MQSTAGVRWLHLLLLLLVAAAAGTPSTPTPTGAPSPEATPTGAPSSEPTPTGAPSPEPTPTMCECASPAPTPTALPTPTSTAPSASDEIDDDDVFDGDGDFETWELVVVLVICFLPALILGLERQLQQKPVGFGTFIYVASGACTLTLVARQLTPAAPLPLMSGIVSGIGFLGAGALIRTSTGGVFGFTTAALIWGMAAFGITVAAEEFALAGFFYLIVWIVIVIDRLLQRFALGAHARTVTLKLRWHEGWWEALRDTLPRGVTRKKVELARDEHGENTTVMVVLGCRLQPDAFERFIGRLTAITDLRSISCE